MTREETLEAIKVMQAFVVKGYEDYCVTKDGSVYSKRKKKTYVKLKPGYTKGYQYVYMVNDNGVKKMWVHRLVADAFVRNDDNLPYVDHINTIRDDNRAENLRWCTAKQNSGNASTIRHQRESSKTNELRNVDKYSLEGVLLGTYPSPQRGAMSEGHTGNSCISRCCNGKRLSAYQKIWRWEGEPFDKYDMPLHPCRQMHRYSKIGQYDINGNMVREFNSMMEAERSTGINHQSISACCANKHKHKTAGGFIWKYIY